MAEILVTAQTVRTKAGELSNMNGQFRLKVSDLETQEAELNSMWKGAANDAFHKAFTADVQQMQKFATEIDKYVQALNNIATEYEKAEQMNTEIGNTRSYR